MNEEKIIDLYKAKRLDNNEWVEGYLYRISQKLDPFIMVPGSNGTSYAIAASTICRCCGKEYMDSEMAYEGDIFESQVCGLRMVLKYGTYLAYCPEDNCFMDSVGFYVEAEGHRQMPIGNLKEYALKIGSIFDVP